MNTQNKRRLLRSLSRLSAFLLWTVLVRLIDVRPVGPLGSAVGFAALNQAVHSLTGVHLPLYTATDLLSLVPLGFVLGFAGLGLAQWVRRRSLRRVDRCLIALGGFYLVVLAGCIGSRISSAAFCSARGGGAVRRRQRCGDAVTPHRMA